MNITKIDTPLNDFLLELAKWHRENGREDVCKWKVCVTNSLGRLVSGGSFWIPPALLKQAEEEGDDSED